MNSDVNFFTSLIRLPPVAQYKLPNQLQLSYSLVTFVAVVKVLECSCEVGSSRRAVLVFRSQPRSTSRVCTVDAKLEKSFKCLLFWGPTVPQPVVPIPVHR